MHAQPTTNVTVSSAPTVPIQQQSQDRAADRGRHQARHQAPAPADPAAKPARQPLFRLHTTAHEIPRAGRVLGLTFWAAMSIFVGLIPATRLVAGFVLQIQIIQWYPVAATSMAMLGLALITLAFASIHRARLPWALMTIATSLLTVNVAMVYLVPW